MKTTNELKDYIKSEVSRSGINKSGNIDHWRNCAEILGLCLVEVNEWLKDNE